MDITSLRLHNQRLVGEKFTKPQAVVEYFGAMQAQDYYGAKWSLGLRLHETTDAFIDEAFNRGDILRTHVMRPTWHFVTPGDIRWMLMLTGPRVHAYNGYYYRKSGLDKSIFAKSNTIIEKALSGGKKLTRDELNTILKQSKIPTDRLGLSYTIIQAELDAIICSGPRVGKQFTYMLLEERVPKTKMIDRKEALAKLVLRYFTAHGPATVQDCMWWSGLTAVDIKAGIDANKSHLSSETSEGKIYWFGRRTSVKKSSTHHAILLPTYDEYLIAYKDRSAAYEANATHEKAFQDGFWNTIILNGKIVGTWRRVIAKKSIQIQPRFFRDLHTAEKDALDSAVKRYAAFMGINAHLG